MQAEKMKKIVQCTKNNIDTMANVFIVAVIEAIWHIDAVQYL